MDSIELNGGRMVVKVDDSLNAHGSQGVDFWRVSNGCDTELFTLDNKEAYKLMEWLFNYLKLEV